MFDMGINSGCESVTRVLAAWNHHA